MRTLNACLDRMINGMESLNIKSGNNVGEKFSETAKCRIDDWESWSQLKLSAYHGRKLAKRNFRPYHPKVAEKTFFLHEIDNIELEPEEKWLIVMRTFKKLFGNFMTADTAKGRKFNTKMSFLREKGKENLKAGKSIQDWISFPDSYWEEHKRVTEAKAPENKTANESYDLMSKRPRLSSSPDQPNSSGHTSGGVQTRKRKLVKNEVRKLTIFTSE